MNRHFLNIESKLVTQVGKPEEIQLKTDFVIRDPFEHYDDLNPAPYLGFALNDDEDTED
jgi:hypothetical protein